MTLATAQAPLPPEPHRRCADVVKLLTDERNEALAQLATAGRQRDAAVARLRRIANIAQEAP